MRQVILVLLLLLSSQRASTAQSPDSGPASDSIVVRLVDVELKAAVQLLSRYLDRPVVFGELPSLRVTLEAPRPLPRSSAARVLASLLAAHGFRLDTDSTTGGYRIAARESRAMPPATSSAGGRDAVLSVIRLRHAKAADVAATIAALFGRSAAFAEQGVPGTSGPPKTDGVSTTGIRGAVLRGELTVVPDPRANTLMVRALPADVELVSAAVKEIDVRPLQVLIEVVIAELRRDRTLDLGTDAQLAQTPVGANGRGSLSATNSGGGLGTFAVRLLGLAGGDVSATLRAAASRGDVRILSRPLLLAANNEAASISVGSQRPFIEVSRVLPTDNTARDQVVQYRDVGTRLEVTPTISDDGYVMLAVSQEVSAATAEQQFNAPVISTRSVKTKLMLRSGQTAALGGITDQQSEVTRSGIPLLSSIPLIGALFGRSVNRNNRTELLLFLTPQVLSTDAAIDSASRATRTAAPLQARP